MGCVIHASVEYARRADWTVHVLDAGFLPRDYRFFGCLVAGHRRCEDIAGAIPERGLPPEPSRIGDSVRWTQEHNEDFPDCAVCFADHTFSWLSPDEYRAAIALYEAFGVPLDAVYHALAAYMDRLAQAGPVRLVFGFDN